jgi:hypothetical protein
MVPLELISDLEFKEREFESPPHAVYSHSNRMAMFSAAV